MSNDIRVKSTAFLLDSLVTTVIKCFFAQEQIMNPNLSKRRRLEAAIHAQELNAKRSELLHAIDVALKEKDISMGGKKSYYTYFDQSPKKRKEVAMSTRKCGGKKGKKGGKKKKG